MYEELRSSLMAMCWGESYAQKASADPSKRKSIRHLLRPMVLYGSKRLVVEGRWSLDLEERLLGRSLDPPRVVLATDVSNPDLVPQMNWSGIQLISETISELKLTDIVLTHWKILRMPMIWQFDMWRSNHVGSSTNCDPPSKYLSFHPLYQRFHPPSHIISTLAISARTIYLHDGRTFPFQLKKHMSEMCNVYDLIIWANQWR